MEIRTTLPPSYSFLFSFIGVSHVKGDIFSWTLRTWLYQIFTTINILNIYWVLISMSLYLHFNSLPFLKLGQNLGVILIFLDGCFKIICMVIWREDFLGFMDTVSTYSWSGIRTHKLGRSDVTAYGSIRRTDWIAQGSLIFVTIITTLTIIFSFTHSTNNTIYDCWYPFDASSGILLCISLFSQMLAAYTLAYTLVGYCYYYVKLILLICSQFEGLRDSLRELKQRAITDLIHSKEDMVKNIVLNETVLEEPLLPQIIEARMQEQLSRNVVHHNELYRLMQKVKVFYSTPFLVQYVTIAVDLGLSLYITVIIPTYDFDFLVNCVVWVYQIPQAVCYSWFGTKLIEKVHAVRQAAYDCEWYSTTKPFKKCILIIMSRCDQKFMLTAGKIATVTVQTFITVMQSVVSYMTIVANFATKAENTPESFNSTNGYI